MKSRFVAFAICCAVVVISASLLFLSERDAAGQNRVAVAPTVRPELANSAKQYVADAPGMDNVPRYPGVMYVMPQNPAPFEWSSINYRVNRNYHDVADFYRTTLPRMGWIIDREKGDEYDITLFCSWSHNTDLLPFTTKLYVRITRLGIEPSTLSDIFHTLVRVPSYKRVPIYPNAQNVVVQRGLEESELNGREITVFQTNDSPDDVESYYSDLLVQFGYVRHEKPDINGLPGLAFSYAEGGPEEGVYGVFVSIITRKLPEGLTEVEIRAKSTLPIGP